MAAGPAYAQAVSQGSDLRAAIDAWRNALRINPHYAIAHAALARLYRKAGDPSSAQRHENYFHALETWNRQKNARRL